MNITLPDNFNFNIYRYINGFINWTDDEVKWHWCNHGQYENRIYKLPDNFNLIVYKVENSFNGWTNEELIWHWCNHGHNENRIYSLPNNFNLNVYKNENNFNNWTDEELIWHWCNHGKYENRIYNFENHTSSYKNKKIKIIVSRYNENIEWTKNFQNIIIYNKGSKLNIPNEILLDNVGREGHTYYYHILNNYDNLDDYFIFVQGNPFDHSPNIINDINYYINNIENINIDFRFLSKDIYKINLNGCPCKPGLQLKEIYYNLFGEFKDNLTFEFGAGAQFIANKNNILKKSKEFYLKIIKLLEYNSDPIEGHIIERFHKLILS